MISIRAQRGPVRAAFTKTLNELKAELEKDPKDELLLQKLFRRLEGHRSRILTLNEKITEKLLCDPLTPEEDFNDEYAGVNEYEEKFTDVQVDYETALKVKESEFDTASQISGEESKSGKKTKYRLPKLEFHKFGGDPKDWLMFWSQFSSINEDEEMSPVDKFQYLIQATIEGSKARDVINSFPPTGANYPKVIVYLKERFGKEDTLVEVYVRELLKLVLENVNKKITKIASLYDRLETQLRALDTLGVTEDKYAAMLYPLVESCLPEETMMTWERQRHQIENEDKVSNLQRLMKFLRAEVDGEERVQLAKDGFGREGHKKSKEKKGDEGKVPTATDLFSSQGSKSQLCLFCDKGHSSIDCYTAPKMSLDQKRKVIAEKKGCYNCLRVGHMSRSCKAKPHCQVCGKKHVVIMCPELASREVKKEQPKEEKVDEVQTGDKDKAETNLSSHCTGAVMLQTLLLHIQGPGGERVVRVLIDTGSERSYITEKAADVLNLVSQGKVMIKHNLFGGSSTGIHHHRRFEVKVQSIDRKSCKTLQVLDQPTICGQIARGFSGPWLKELTEAGIKLTDIGEGRPDVHLLIGADYAGSLFTGKIYPTKAGPVAMETILGWTVMGPNYTVKPTGSTTLVVTSLAVTDMDIQSLWRLDVLGIEDSTDTKSREEEMQSAQDNFLQNVKVDEERRYEVVLPWIECHPPVPNNYEVAKKRLMTATSKLKAQGKYDVYQRCIDDWEADGIVEKVPEGGSKLMGSYLPHRPVFKETSLTTPVRPVFDASTKSKERVSLNECLEKGPNYIEVIPDIVTRFRLGEIGILADIKKAFLQISIREKDREFLRFLWWNAEGAIQEYRHCRVPFGVTSSPFLLAATLNYHLDMYKENHLAVVETLKKSLYIDNVVTSLESIDEAMDFMRDSTQILMDGNFELRGWAWTGCNELVGQNTIVSVLGLLWDTESDTLRLDMRGLKELSNENVTKRQILSAAHRIFDPIGLISPVMLVPKMLLQDLWILKRGWDEPVDENIAKQFQKWYRELSCLEQLEIPRWYLERQSPKSNWSFHVFCDASKRAYAGLVFLRTVDALDVVNVQLVTAKVRVAPTKRVTIPRLELMGCLIASRLASKVKEQMSFTDIQTTYWTDSSNALAWIEKNENWAAFVYNRVQEIRKLSKTTEWRHIPGDQNPADLPSRGCSARSLVASKWWEGPDWLRMDETGWPKSDIQVDPVVINSERKKVVNVHSVVDELPWYVNRLSSFRKTVRMIAWMMRWKSKKARKINLDKELTHDEEKRAEDLLWKMVQSNHYNENTNLVKQLNAKKDDKGIWRVQTKLIMREDFHNFKYPILLPSNDPIVSLMIRELHQKRSHAGVQTLMTMLRERYWIVQSRSTIKKVIAACGKCRRFSAKKADAIEAPLPVDRVRDAAVFEITGIDLGGPLYLREKKKAWFVLFTCAVFRAVHLELVTSLSTDAFLQAFRRFIARRGRPRIIYSDNGTNFEGASNAMNKLDWDVICKHTDCHQIVWKFNPPSAPWWGGWWERVIQMVKKILRRVLGRASLDYEELLTILMDCEDIINSRPLTYVSEDASDLQPLTPNMFLREATSGSVYDLDDVEGSALNRRLKYRQQLRDNLRQRFRSEYLGLLVHRLGKLSGVEVKVGDIVIIETENRKRLDWPLARVMELFPGRDGVKRVATVKTKNGLLTRPIQRLFPLEVRDEERKQLQRAVEDHHDGEERERISEVFTRSRRRVKPVDRLRY